MMLGSDCKGSCQADALLHPSAQLPNVPFAPSLETHSADDLDRPLAPLPPSDAAYFEPKGDIVDHGSMRQQSVMLEHHGELLAPHRAKTLRIHLHEIFAVEAYFTGGGL